jgi:hypothetical protein
MTPKLQAQKLLIMFDYDIDSCLTYCNNKIKYNVTPSFYEKVKIELLNYNC